VAQGSRVEGHNFRGHALRTVLFTGRKEKKDEGGRIKKVRKRLLKKRSTANGKNIPKTAVRKDKIKKSRNSHE
jgi:hypothetical protein